MLHAYSREFIEFALKNKALLFGEFTLKSGRASPYFFNTGCFNSGAAIARLGQFYARAITASAIDFDMLFGLAYKGIPLVTSVAIALAEHHGISKPYAFDRKEIKDHGEGGLIVGAPLAGRVLVIDDVISAGVSIEHGANIIKAAGATMAGIVISMDRQERTQHGELSAVGEVERKYQAPVLSVAKLADLLHYLQQNRHQADNLARVRAYNETYGAKQS
jgi:orotate phosphoribosyltransferase